MKDILKEELVEFGERQKIGKSKCKEAKESREALRVKLMTAL